MIERIPCPYCGNTEIQVHFDPVDCKTAFAVCIKCNARGPYVEANLKRLQEVYNSAIELWNKRVSKCCVNGG